MNNKNLRIIEILALSVSIIVTALVMLRFTEWKIDSGIFVLFLAAISPYICLFLVDIVLRKFAPTLKMSLVFCGTSLLMLGLTLFIYVYLLAETPAHRSSTDVLVFVVVPFYLYVGGAVVLVGGLIWALLSKSYKNKNI